MSAVANLGSGFSSSSTGYRAPSRILLEQGTLIKQGAEAKVYAVPCFIPTPTVYWPPSSSSSSSAATSSAPHSSANEDQDQDQDQSLIIKYRFPKTYRHPTLDASLTKTRLSFEARSLARASRAGVIVPRVLWVDEGAGVIGLERVEGWSVREILGGGAEGELEVVEEELREGEEAEEALEHGHEEAREREGEAPGGNEGMEALRRLGVSQEHLMSSIGTALARLHQTTIIHGDLTTSNMMVRLTPNHDHKEAYEIVLIDFGLSSTAQFPEHYAVDLYVLERAFASTHPQSEALYAGVLEAYARGLGEKKWRPIEIKLKDVRRRGRKRDMTG